LFYLFLYSKIEVMVLFLNDVAGSEIVLILLFILIFFGSKSIPNIASTLGKTMRQIKDASNDVQNEIKKSGLDIKKDLNLGDGGFIKETVQDIQRPLDQYVSDLDDAISYKRQTAPIKTPPTLENNLEEKQEHPSKVASELSPNSNLNSEKQED
jgi:sec-independent protein translocase protein TatA